MMHFFRQDLFFIFANSADLDEMLHKMLFTEKKWLFLCVLQVFNP